MGRLSSHQKLLLVGIAGAVLVIGLMSTCVIPGWKWCAPAVRTQGVELTVWGVFDSNETWGNLEGPLAALAPGITIKYRKIPFDDYEEELIQAFAARRGPDIFYIDHTWIPKFADKIEPMPEGEGWPTFAQYRDTFVDAVTEDFTRDRTKIYAVPLYMNTLALYYNRDLFNSAGIAEPPTTWEEFQEAVEKLTVVDATGTIVRSGAAIGTARNVNRSTDILALLMLQTFGDQPLVDPVNESVNFLNSQRLAGGGSFQPGVEALRFYTDFANPALRSYTWNDAQHYSLDAFIEGSTAMTFNYSHHIETIRSRAPQLSFGIARMPQPSALVEQKRAVNYANYFGLAVAKTDDHRKKEAAWRVVAAFLDANVQKAYSAATGLLPARRDLLDDYKDHPDLAVFAAQALSARTWYQPDNVVVERALADAIDAVVDGTASPHEALARAAGEVSVLFRSD